MKVKNDHRSKFSNLSNWKEEAWKKSGLQRDSNPWPPRYRCVALPTELWSHTLGVRSIYWVHISREEWNDVKYKWNNSFLNCGCRWKWRMIIAVNFQLKQLERSPWWKKKSGLQRDSNLWPLHCRCVALPTELWSHTLGARSIYWVHISHEEWNDVKYNYIIQNVSLPWIGNLLRWSFFTFINCFPNTLLKG